MLKTYKPKEPIDVMEKTDELALIVEQKRFLEYLLNLDREEELHHHDPITYIYKEPREFVNQFFFICLRGLREGLLELMEIYRTTDLLKIAFHEEYEQKIYDKSKRKMEKTDQKIDPIEECIRRRLLKNPDLYINLAWNNSEEMFKSNCHDIASCISVNYAHLLREKIISKLS